MLKSLGTAFLRRGLVHVKHSESVQCMERFDELLKFVLSKGHGLLFLIDALKTAADHNAVDTFP